MSEDTLTAPTCQSPGGTGLRPNRRWLVFFGLSLLMPAAMWGLEPYGGLVQSDVAQEVYEHVTRILRPDRPLEIYFYPDDDRRHPGYFPRIDITLDGLHASGLRIAGGQIGLAGADVDLGALFDQERLRLKSGRVEGGRVVLDERDLMAYLAGSGSVGLSGIDLRILPDLIEVTASLPLGPLSPRATLRGSFQVVEGGRIVLFHPLGIDAGLFGSTPATLDSLFQKLNPVLDLGRFEADSGIVARIDRVDLTPGALIVSFR